MTVRHVAFLRAINTVGRRTKNNELVAVFESAGADFAAGFLASGNVVFDWPEAVDDPATARIEAALSGGLGFEVPALIRRASEVQAVADHAPFPDSVMREAEGTMFVAFLRRPLEPEAAAAVMALQTDSDQLAVHDRQIYWLPMAGEFNSELSVPAVERAAGEMTVRTINTVRRISAKFL